MTADWRATLARVERLLAATASERRSEWVVGNEAKRVRVTEALALLRGLAEPQPDDLTAILKRALDEGGVPAMYRALTARESSVIDPGEDALPSWITFKDHAYYLCLGVVPGAEFEVVERRGSWIWPRATPSGVVDTLRNPPDDLILTYVRSAFDPHINGPNAVQRAQALHDLAAVADWFERGRR